MEYAKKIVEQAGYKVKSIVLTRDIGMKKKSLYEGIEGLSNLTDHVDEEDIQKAKEAIVKAIREE